MSSTRSRKKHKKRSENKSIEDWEKQLNIRYHAVNAQWNHTIFARADSTQVKKGKKRENRK